MSSFAADHSGWDALAVGWALSALDPDDEDLFAAHLPGCDRCTATVRESLDTVSDLAYGIPDEEPPPSLKAALMAAVRAEPRGSAGVPAAAPAAPSAPAVASAPAVPSAPAAPAVPSAPEAEPGDEPEWPTSAPRPGSPAGPVDWFARPGGPDGEPPPGEAEPRTGDRLFDQPRYPGGPRQDDRSPRGGPRPYGEPSAQGDRMFGEPPGDGPPEAPPQRRYPEPPRAADGPLEAAQRRYPEPPRPGDGPPEAPPQRRYPEPPRPAGGPLGQPPRPGDPSRGRHAAADGDDGTVVPLEPRRRTRARRLTALAAAAAAIALVAGLTAWNVRLRDDRDELRRVAAQRETAISQLTANRPARIAALTGDGKPSATRRATLVVRGDRVEVLVEGLPPSAGDQRYWLWTLRCDTAAPTDLRPIRGFQVTQRDFSVRDIGSDPGLATATCFAISSEVGTATPTAPREVVAVGQPS